MKREDKKWNVVLSFNELIKIRSAVLNWASYIEYQQIPEWKEVGMEQKDVDSLIREKEEAEKIAELLFERFSEAEPAGE